MKPVWSAATIAAVLLIASPPAPAQSANGVRAQVDTLNRQVQALSRQVIVLRRKLAATERKLANVEANSVLKLDGIVLYQTGENGTPTVLINGANLQVTNGAGATEAANGAGNVLIGYNAPGSASPNRGGSHNLVLGDAQPYPQTSNRCRKRYPGN